ncbi:MAG: nuclease-like protein [Gammaproteobacteria bacterium]|nr:nuclease-like protein [Gammaproteobacteria bacterium]NIR90059.1 nuclease-like protein [Gammaproteobacteria bacterium]NIU03263.1 nuclease-like protein [Gammaproteobacteria bacterium]NIV50757.1 nuclease-like protein [Gammaproteobacteria bacterium]NIV75343.1 nuclease-like protein [Gammaproteobacteria bacterium]
MAAVLSLLLGEAIQAREIVSYAFVQDDATLRVRGKTIRLFGIHVPETERTCRTFIHPVQCGSRAVLALEFKIGARFVHCDTVRKNEDASVTAVCRVDDEDLSAYLISRGWAVALPDAPFEYHILEKIARHKSFGVWGFQADVIQR